MTEITPYTTPAPMPAPQTAVADYQGRAVARLGEWAQSAEAAYRVSETLVQTSFVPQAFRGKPMEATAAILAGSEVGLSPMASLRSFDVIQGQAAPRAITLRAIVQSYGHEMELLESTATRCRMRGRRRGATDWQTVTWTIDRARDLGLLGKQNWKQQPGAMLLARATSELARLIAADAILGIGYTAEEITDGSTGDVAPAPQQGADAPTEGRRVMSRKRPAQPAQEQPADDQGEVEQPTGEAPSEAAIRAMFASFADAGMPDARTTEGRQQRLDYIGQVVGREVTSSKELTADEVSRVIDALKSAPAPADEDDTDPWAEAEQA